MGFFQAVARVPGDFARDLRMNRTQALIFLTSWFCWTIGSMHYFMLSYTMAEIAKDLGVEQSKIAQANTTSMLSRALGAVIFGVLSDKFGRKIPLLIDLVLMGVFTLCTGFIHTYGQLIGVRFLFGKSSSTQRSPLVSYLTSSRHCVWRYLRRHHGRFARGHAA